MELQSTSDHSNMQSINALRKNCNLYNVLEDDTKMYLFIISLSIYFYIK